MELYVVDANWLKTDAVEAFDSVVWTDRYTAYGDVTLTLPDSVANRALITEGVFLHCPDSPSIMIIETINIKDGLITAQGTDLLYFLRNRMFRWNWNESNNNSLFGNDTAWGTIYVIMVFLANPGSYLTSGTVLTSAQGTNEAMPKITVSNVGPAGPNPVIPMSVPYGNLYDAVKQIADADSLGLKLAPQSMTDGTGNVLFQVYRGLDRTTSQSTNSIVVFDPALDNLVGVEELRDISGYKNVAWVWPTGITAQSQIVAVYAPGASTLTGWNRRSLMVIADDVSVADYTAANLALVLKQKGLDALANNNYAKLVDGQVVPQSMYQYGSDYNLGDVVELRGALGSASQRARVTEYIRSQDSTGSKAYPTLQVVV